MDEIKFRVWCNSDEEWIYSFDTGLSRFFAICDGEYSEEVDAKTLTQYIGLKDNTGKEIYEGDILKFDPREWGDDKGIFLVEWDSEEAQFSTGGGLPKETGEWKTIIGNKTENPGLLLKLY